VHVTIIGLGLIGGSIARDLRRTGFAKVITGVETNPSHARQSLDLGLVQSVVSLADAVSAADLTILAIPVDAIVGILPAVLDAARGPRAVVVDMGSTKQAVVESVQAHPRRSRFVAAHPMAGTEDSGPDASVEKLFHGKMAILCDTDDSAPDAVAAAQALFVQGLGMRLVNMSSARHDLHAAYVSHLSHVASYALALTALAKEQEEQAIFTMAGGGFASTARLAKSSADMWEPIFRLNREPLLEAIDSFQAQLHELRAAIAASDRRRVRALIETANRIRDILPRPAKS
jgi:prephenate dehydrogenase